MNNLEELLEEVGAAGRFQVFLLILVLLAKVPVAYSMIEMAFANYVPKWCCLPDVVPVEEENLYCDVDNPGSNHSIFAKNCSFVSGSCDNRVFLTGIQSIVNEWDLVCDSKWMVPLTTSIQMAGVLVGTFTAGQVADLFGRKYTLLAFEVGVMVLNVGLGFPNQWTVFVVLRFFVGIAIGGFVAIHMTYLIEFLSAKQRSLPAMIPAFQLGGYMLALVSWQIPDWRWVHWICAMMMVPPLLFFRFLPESLRWLTVKGKLKEADQVVEQIAAWNKRSKPANTMAVLEKIMQDAKSTQKESNRYSYISLYKGWRMFKKTTILSIIWFLISMTAYGFTFGASSLGFSVFVNIFLLNTVGIPFLFVQNTVINWLGRRKSIVIAVSAAAASACTCLVISLAVTDTSVKTPAINIISVISRGLMSAGWAPLLVYTNELYPTVIRGLGFGAANTFARIGAMAAPFVVNFEDYPALGFGVTGVGLFLICVLVCFLEETKGKAMKDTMEDKAEDIHQGTHKDTGQGDAGPVAKLI